jgi:hypothetical protein
MANVCASKKFVASFRTDLRKDSVGTPVISTVRLVFLFSLSRMRLQVDRPGFCFKLPNQSSQGQAIVNPGKKTNAQLKKNE